MSRPTMTLGAGPDGPGRAARLRRRCQTAAIVAVALVQLSGSAAHTEATTLTPPYASGEQSCSGTGTCDAAADSATGDLRINAAAVGSTATATTGHATANVSAVHTFGAEAEAIKYTVNFDVLEAVATTAGCHSVWYFCATAYVWLFARADHTNCPECSSYVSQTICESWFLGADGCAFPPGRVTWVSDPANGSAAINQDKTVTYDPDGCFVGSDTFIYTIDDGKGRHGQWLGHGTAPEEFATELHRMLTTSLARGSRWQQSRTNHLGDMGATLAGSREIPEPGRREPLHSGWCGSARDGDR
jgi:hypothetical protein